MKSWLWNLLLAIGIGIFYGSGYLFGFFAWTESEIGPWFFPLIFGVCVFALVGPAVIRGVVEGVREAGES